MRHRILGVLLTLVVLLPFAVQATHALENHKHQICVSQDVQHLHNQELDCSIYHTPVNQNAFDLGFEYTVFIPKKFSYHFGDTIQTTSLGYSSFKSSRAPPSFII